jgi:hypothetical protein
MKERMPVLRPEKKLKKPSAADLAKEWERKLAKEGLTAEPEEDKAAAILRKQIEAEDGPGISEIEIRQKVQEHLLGRAVSLGHESTHRAVADAVAHGLGISADDIPNDLIDAAEGDLAEVQRKIREVIDSKKGQAVRFHYDQMNAIIMRELGDEHSDFSPMALQEIISDALERFKD